MAILVLSRKDSHPKEAESCNKCYTKGIYLCWEKKALIPVDKHSMVSRCRVSLCIRKLTVVFQTEGIMARKILVTFGKVFVHVGGLQVHRFANSQLSLSSFYSERLSDGGM